MNAGIANNRKVWLGNILKMVLGINSDVMMMKKDAAMISMAISRKLFVMLGKGKYCSISNAVPIQNMTNEMLFPTSIVEIK